MLLLVGLRRLFQNKLKKEHSITLVNQGNVPSVYHLLADSVEPRLKFRFTQNNIPLPIVAVQVKPPVENNRPSLMNPTAGQVSAGDSPINKPNPVQSNMKTGSVLAGTGKASEKVVAKTGAAASLMGMLGSILPGSLGKSLKEQSTAVRGVQSKTKKVMEQPQGIQRKMDQVQKDSGKLGVKSSMPQLQPEKQVFVPEIEKVDSNKPAALIQTTPAQSSTVQTVNYSCTPAMDPGDMFTMTLRINGKKRIPTENSYLYTIKSLQVPLDKFDKEISPVTKQGIVHFDHFSKWHYRFHDLLSVLLVLGGILAIVYSISLIWL